MKRKTAYAIVLFLISVVLAKLWTGGGKEGAPDGEILRIAEEGSVLRPEGDLPASEGDYRTGVEGFLASEEESRTSKKDFLTLQEELRSCVLQIFCGDYRGSGIVWEITEEEVIVVSSGHLLQNGETCEVLCYAGVYYEARVDRILENCDVGFAVFSARALEEDGVELRAASSGGRNREELVQGEELIVYGSMMDVAGDFVRGYLIDAESEMQFEGYDQPQDFILGGVLREESTAPEKDDSGAGDGEYDRGEEGTEGGQGPGEEEEGAGKERNGLSGQGLVDAGMSGSGVFDGQGELLGILAGGDGESYFAAVPIWDIEE